MALELEKEVKALQISSKNEARRQNQTG